MGLQKPDIEKEQIKKAKEIRKRYFENLKKFNPYMYNKLSGNKPTNIINSIKCMINKSSIL